MLIFGGGVGGNSWTFSCFWSLVLECSIIWYMFILYNLFKRNNSHSKSKRLPFNLLISNFFQMDPLVALNCPKSFTLQKIEHPTAYPPWNKSISRKPMTQMNRWCSVSAGGYLLVFDQLFSRLQICVVYMFGNKRPQMVPIGIYINVGFQGLAAWIQGQIYNPRF